MSVENIESQLSFLRIASCFSSFGFSDNEDHTFCGIMFPIQAKADLPVSQLLIRSVSIRGHLGPLTVWVSNDDIPLNEENYCVSSLQHIRSDARAWTKIYEKAHNPSRHKYQELNFSDNPVVMKPGQTRVFYVHSAAHHDLAIVYDNSYSMRSTRYSDCFLSILSGAAHLSPEPFDRNNIWGWGSAWRDYREFVGQINFGAVYQLWCPEKHLRFGNKFQDVTETILACQRRAESPLSMLPDECIYYILNMCRWDWFDDCADKMGSQRKVARRQGRKTRSQQSKRDCVNSEPSTSEAGRRWRAFNAIGSIRQKILDAFSA